MGISKYPSRVTLPQKSLGWLTVVDFLIEKFPAIDAELWLRRMQEGKVHWDDGTAIKANTPYQPQRRVCYYREVVAEPIIPFREDILFQDGHLLVAYKPHFLPVTPGGRYVDECLQNRLRSKTGIDELQALHRLDRETAGLVLFSTSTQSRPLYHDLFAQRKIEKRYQAIAVVSEDNNLVGKAWCVENRMERSDPRFTMEVVEGDVNARSDIECVEQKQNRALFLLSPITGKTHQLRVHMQTIGYPILHDKFYPQLQPKVDDDFSIPLQLLAKELRFVDPITGEQRHFSCDHFLQL